MTGRVVARSRSTTDHWSRTDWRALERSTEVDGRRVRYVDIGSGPPLLLVHGLGCTWRVWLENLVDLSRDHRVVAVDLPGFGGSGMLARGSDLKPYAAVLAGLMDHLGLARATVVGHSLGGLVCQHLALEHPDCVARLMLVSSAGPRVSRARTAALTTAFLGMSSVGALPPVSLVYQTSPLIRRRVLARLVGDPARVSTRLSRELARDYSASGIRSAIFAGRRDRLGMDEVEQPGLVLWGTADRILPVAFAPHLLPRAPHVIWDGIGHLPMIERPEAFNALVKEFAASRTS